MTYATLAGILAAIITVAALVRKDDKHLLLVMGIGVSVWTLHYALLGTVPGAVVHGIAAVSILSAHAVQSWSLTLRYIAGLGFASLGVASTVLYGEGLADVFAALGCVVFTMSQYVASGTPRRLGFFAGEVLLFIFALLIGSLPGMVVTLTNIIANGVGIVRQRRSVPQHRFVASPGV